MLDLTYIPTGRVMRSLISSRFSNRSCTACCFAIHKRPLRPIVAFPNQLYPRLTTGLHTHYPAFNTNYITHFLPDFAFNTSYFPGWAFFYGWM